MRVLIIGASGLVGSHLVQALSATCEVVGTARSPVGSEMLSLDIRELDEVERCFSAVRPDVVLLAAAEAHVDYCEQHPDIAARTNVVGTANVLRVSSNGDARLVFFSSDYVFDGLTGGYSEDSPARPLNEYGRQKHAAEQLVLARGDSLVVRTSGVFGDEQRRKNFVFQVIDRLIQGHSVSAASDQVLCPTWAQELATAVSRLIAAGASGVIHVCGSQPISRFDFARLAALTFGLDVSNVQSAMTTEAGVTARRPPNSSMRCDRLVYILGNALSNCEIALERYRATTMMIRGRHE